MRAKRQYAQATTHVTMKRPTMTKPAVLMLKRPTKLQKAWRVEGSGLLADQAQQDLHRADEKRDGDREPGDREVVEDIPHRVGEGPVGGKVHEAAVERVEEAHASCEEVIGVDKIPRERQPPNDGRSSQDEQRDLRCAVSNPRPKRTPTRYIFHDGSRSVGENRRRTVHQAPVGELPIQFRCVIAAGARLPIQTEEGDQYPEIDERDQKQERARDRRADDVSGGMESGRGVAHLKVGAARMPKFSARARTNTTVEWPSEKAKPTPSGRLPSPTSLRVVLSIAAMWSASKAWRIPRV